MSPLLFLSIAAVCSLGAMSPGPSLAVVIRNTVAGGRAGGLATAWAHALGIGFYALLTTFGLAALIVQSQLLYLAITVAGATYLVYLGVQSLRGSGAIPSGADATASMATGRSARQGFLMALLNPKVAAFFLAVFSQFLRPGMGAADHLAMSAIATLVDGLWYTLVALLLTRTGWMDKLRRYSRHIEHTTSIVLIALAVVGVARLAAAI